MIDCKTLETYLNNLLMITLFRDYAPNGLQVSGKPEIKTLVSGVTASVDFLTRALELNADAVLVHHGYFWKGEDVRVVGTKQKRLKLLLENDVNLFAYHLPLDAHMTFGNNVMLAQKLGFTIETPDNVEGNRELLFTGGLSQPVSPDAFTHMLQTHLSCVPLAFNHGRDVIQKVAWCTGAAQDYIHRAATYDVDAYITGEVSERTYYEASELGLHFYACGHHATERYGVQAVGAHLAKQFGLTHQFVDSENPV